MSSVWNKSSTLDFLCLDAIFNIELLNGSIVKVKGYNEIADYCYSNLNKGNIVCVEGRINSKIAVIIDKIYKI